MLYYLSAGATTHRRRRADVRQARGQPAEARDACPAPRPAGHPGAGGAAAAARRRAAAVPHAPQIVAVAPPAAAASPAAQCECGLCVYCRLE